MAERRLSHRLVVDANILVDMCLEKAGVLTGRRGVLDRFLMAVSHPVELDGSSVLVTMVLSEHIVKQAERALVVKYRFQPDAAARSVFVAAKFLLGDHGLYDPTVEDYALLSRRAWYRLGTDAEDEAVLACAERTKAGVVTQDKEFLSYLVDSRHWPAWSLTAFAAKVCSNRL